jgi:hypothetical protein
MGVIFNLSIFKTMKKLLLILILFSSCNVFYEEIVPDEFSPYVENFKYQANKYGIDIKTDRIEMRFATDEEIGGVVGVARDLDSGRKLILINYSYWIEFDYKRKEYLIFHELGHAVLGRGHKNDYIVSDWDEDLRIEGYNVICDVRYLSIMASGGGKWTVGCGFYELHYEEYMQELFTGNIIGNNSVFE